VNNIEYSVHAGLKAARMRSQFERHACVLLDFLFEEAFRKRR
jgi:hypothetical protein